MRECLEDLRRSPQMLAEGAELWLARSDAPIASAAGRYLAEVVIRHAAWLKAQEK